MSDTDESAVLVQAPSDTSDSEQLAPELISEEEPMKQHVFAPVAMDKKFSSGDALQIFSIGSEEDQFAFKYHEDKLEEVIKKIPKNSEVAVVSVVGAFRTGKSFLLSWFLRYLNHHNFTSSSSKQCSTPPATDPWYKQFQSLNNDGGFDWRGGSERNTTGLWMWSQPYFISKNIHGSDQKMAVLLVDTQGMFDNETTMALTASIFGISTLLSSYQIYNVDKRIQEDNLQQLALFSEYARMAVGIEESDRKSSAASIGLNNTSQKLLDCTEEFNFGDNKQMSTSLKPFQRIEFLVRDWQHFDDMDEQDYTAMERSMTDYLSKVIGERDARDLQETRDQIISCFEHISCFGLSHPGISVTKKSFNGDVQAIDQLFLQLLDRYCKKVFNPSVLEPKVIHGRTITADELAVYVKAYADLFSSGASFPTAATMLDATASANNTNAVRMAVSTYKDEMNQIVGRRSVEYITNVELEKHHAQFFLKSQSVFDSIATFGSKRSIEEARELFMRQVEADFDLYQSLNEARNPLSGWLTYGIPAIVAGVSAMLRWIADATCSAQVCRKTSDFLSHTHATGWFFLAILSITKFQQIKDAFLRTKEAIAFLMNSDTANHGKKKVD